MTPAVHVALIIVQALFSGLAIAGRYVLPHVPAGVLVTMRVIGAAVVLLAWNALRGGPWVKDKRDLLWLAGLGFLGIAANQSLFLFGLKHSTAINATILVTTVPVFTVLGSVLIGREPPSALKFAGIGLAAAGAIWLIGPDRLSFARDVAFGNLLITVSAYVMAFAILGVLPLGLMGWSRFDAGAVSPTVWGWVAFIVVGPTIFTYLLNIWALRRASSNMVAVYIYLQPLLTASLAPLVLDGEALTPRAVAAGLLIFTGLAVVMWAERRQRLDMPPEAPVGE
jgi:drug/metabolite transporter (DMT)-like permease